MIVGKACTFILLLVSSVVLQVLNTWILFEAKDDWFILSVVVFLFNVLFPIVVIYKFLIFKGLI